MMQEGKLKEIKTQQIILITQQTTLTIITITNYYYHYYHYYHYYQYYYEYVIIKLQSNLIHEINKQVKT